jgi:hypothetical protein
MAVETTDVVDGWVPKFEDGDKRRLSITALKVTGDPNVPAGRLTFASSSSLKKIGEVPPSGDPGSNCSCQNPCDCWVLRDEGYEVEGYLDGYGKTAMSSPNVYSNPKWSEARMYVLRSFCGGGGGREDEGWYPHTHTKPFPLLLSLHYPSLHRVTFGTRRRRRRLNYKRRARKEGGNRDGRKKTSGTATQRVIIRINVLNMKWFDLFASPSSQYLQNPLSPVLLMRL